MYDIDDQMYYDDTREFLVDCELSENDINMLLDATWDNRDGDTIMLPNVLNNVILHTDLSKQFNSISIMEYGYYTICMLNHSLIKNLEKIK